MAKVVCFGDIMMRLSPFVLNERLAQANNLRIDFAGAEANVCTDLAMLGVDTGYVTGLPENDLALHAVRNLRGFGTNVDNIYYGDGRMGIYFLETGAAVRSSGVIYDRADSVFCRSHFSDYDWDKIFDGCTHFFTTGITPALTDNLRSTTLEVLSEAKKRGIFTVFDLNFRSKLGDVEKFRSILTELAPFIDCLIINEEHSKMLFGIKNEFTEEQKEERVEDFARKVGEILGIRNIAMPVRRTISASDSRIYGGLLLDGKFALGDTHDIHVVDRVGSGDAFSAGIIYSLIKGFEADKAIRFALASCAFKHTILADFNFASAEELLALAEKRGGDVKR